MNPSLDRVPEPRLGRPVLNELGSRILEPCPEVPDHCPLESTPVLTRLFNTLVFNRLCLGVRLGLTDCRWTGMPSAKGDRMAKNHSRRSIVKRGFSGNVQNERAR